jgi:hypothetical protein
MVSGLGHIITGGDTSIANVLSLSPSGILSMAAYGVGGLAISALSEAHARSDRFLPGLRYTVSANHIHKSSSAQELSQFECGPCKLSKIRGLSSF